MTTEFIERLKLECIEYAKRDWKIWSPNNSEIVEDVFKILLSRNLIVQEGEVAVPKAPSEKQIDAALEYCDGYNSKYFMGLYKVMITAAKGD